VHLRHASAHEHLILELLLDTLVLELLLDRRTERYETLVELAALGVVETELKELFALQTARRVRLARGARAVVIHDAAHAIARG